MKTKKIILAAILLITVFMTSSISFAAFQDVPKSAAYTDAAERLVNLGIMSSTADAKFQPDQMVTREQFAKIIVIASGLEELAGTLAGTSAFSDVSASSAASGYINAVLKKGFLTALADGKFHPSDKVTYAQVCTVLVKMLGYTDQDLSGIWPANYIEKARSLGITAGISLKSGSYVSRSNLALMLDKLLDTNIKKSNSSEQDKTFIESTGLESGESFLTYSKPEVVAGFNATTTKIGSIDLKGNSAIIRNTVDNTVSPSVSKIGESIVRSQIKDKDVVYQVTDTRNSTKYIMVVDNKITGEITSILPNKYSPKTIQIDGKDYDLSKYFDTRKINGTSGSYNVGDTVTILLGYDSKVIDVCTTMDEYNEDFALVLDNYTETSTAIDDYGAVLYFVKLLHADGTQKTYRLNTAETGYNGKLVKFNVLKDSDETDDYDTVELESLTYLNNTSCTIDRENGKVGADYVTDNVVIFNLVSTVYGRDSNARIIKWSDMPNGLVAPGKIRYVNKIGDFGDINVMLVDNILDEETAQGLVTKIERKTSQAGTYNQYTVGINGKNYTTATEVPGINVGSVVNVQMSNGSLLSISSAATAWVEANVVEAVDSGRIKVRGVIYPFSSSIAIYIKDYEGNYVRKGINDIVKGKTYGRISFYMDKNPEYGGRVSLIMITPY